MLQVGVINLPFNDVFKVILWCNLQTTGNAILEGEASFFAVIDWNSCSLYWYLLLYRLTVFLHSVFITLWHVIPLHIRSSCTVFSSWVWKAALLSIILRLLCIWKPVLVDCLKSGGFLFDVRCCTRAVESYITGVSYRRICHMSSA